MVSHAEVVRQLLGASLLDGRKVLAGDLWIDAVPSRNGGYKVRSLDGPCYFVKQGIGAEGEASVAREAATYRHLTSRATSGELRRALPQIHGYDESHCLLVLGLSPDSTSLREFHARRGRIPKAVASATGHALARLHQLPPPDTTAGLDPGASPAPAWPLSLHRVGVRILHDASGANLEMIRMIQGFPEFCRLLDGLRAEWKATSLIHFDLKADNCVIAPSSDGARREHEIKIVDWEFAGAGDPCWDIGSIFSDYLGLWVLALPVLADTSPRRFLELTRFPLDRMVPAIRAFWSAYERTIGLTRDEARATLLLAVRYSAARLIQTAFERMQASQCLTGNIVCLLQLSWNMLERPDDAATHLLGLPA